MRGAARVESAAARARGPLLVLIAASVVLLVGNGERGVLGIFLKPMSTDLGWGREVFAFALALQNLLWGLGQPFAGALADRFGSGRVIAISSALYALGLYLMGATGSPVGFTLSAGVLIGLSLCGMGMPLVLAVVGQHAPEARRSLYLGIAGAGASAGQVVMAPIGQILINEVGWFGALGGFALMAFLVVPLAAALRGGAPVPGAALAEQSLREAVAEAARHGGFWLLTAGFFVCGFHVTFLAVHLPAFVSDAGLAPGLGAVALALIGVCNIVGSLACGYLGGRFSKKRLLSAIYLARAVVIGAFVSVPMSETSVLLFAAGIGFLWLGTVPVTSALVAQIFGPRYMATLFGFVFLSHQLGSFTGAWWGGRVFDATGSYDAVWWVAIGLGILAAILHWPIRDAAVPRLAGAAVAE